MNDTIIAARNMLNSQPVPAERTIEVNNFMSEGDAWREIARRIAEGEWDGDGLCSEVGTLASELRISRETKRGMYIRIDLNHEDYEDAGAGYIYDIGDAGPRIMAALSFAELCEAGE